MAVVPPRLIPGFEIVQRIASGGSAGVFHAYREDDGVEVALKVMSLGDLDPDFHPEERFRREAELLTRLSHPVLPQLYGYGVTQEGYAWLALELVRGDPLASFAGRSAQELMPILTALAEGLLAVAQEGIVHRDVAPDNVLVAEMYGRLSPKLIDFGIAKDLFAGGAAAGLTRHGAFLGKLAYASPEQLVGLPKGETLDFRSDVYSLGMTAHELLAGRPAIQATSMIEIVDAHVKGRFPPLAIPVEKGGPAPRLAALVGRMTARQRADRPSSWEEVIAALWLARAELAPLARTLAEKGEARRVEKAAERPPSPPAAETARPPATSAQAPRGEEPAPAPVAAARMIGRELLLGRAALLFGVVAFVASLLFAAHVFLSAPAPPAAVPAAR